MRLSGVAFIRGAGVGGVSAGFLALWTWILRARVQPFLEERGASLGVYLLLLVALGVVGGGLFGLWVLTNPSTEDRVGAGAATGAVLYGGFSLLLNLPLPVTLFGAVVGGCSGGFAAWELVRPRPPSGGRGPADQDS